MPPVLGPWSPSQMRLWSCGAASARRAPVREDEHETSSPSRNSSTTTRGPRRRTRAAPCSARSPRRPPSSVANTTALAGGEAVGLHHLRRALLAAERARGGGVLERAKRAVGMPWRRHQSFANALLPSIARAARAGPNTARPALRSAIGEPAPAAPPARRPRGRSRSARAKPHEPSTSSTARATQRARRAMPALPGAAKSCVDVRALGDTSRRGRARGRRRRPAGFFIRPLLALARGVGDLEVRAGDARPGAAGVELEIALPVAHGLVRVARARQRTGQVEVRVGVVGREVERLPVAAGPPSSRSPRSSASEPRL